jgi:peptidyl-prolyl cis-trans isomerase D
MPKTRPGLTEPDGASKDSSAKRPAPTHPHGRRFSKEELSRHEREVRARRMILMGMGAFVAIVVAILAYGWWHEYVAASSEPVASVSGQSISIESYAKQLDYRRKTVENQVNSMQAQLQQAGPGSGLESLQDMFKQQIQQLQFNLMLLPDQTLDQMISDKLIRQEAAKRGITVTPQEIDAELATAFGDPPTPAPATDAAATGQQAPNSDATPAPTAEPGATQSAAAPVATPAPTTAPASAAGSTPAPTTAEGSNPAPTDAANATPAPTADIQARVTGYSTEYGISRDEIRSLVESQLLYQKLQDSMGAEVPTSAEQVHARHILVDTQDKAKEVSDKLKSGTSFEDLAKSESTDTGTKDKGGDLGWFPKGTMVQEFDDAAFKLDVNQISDPVQTSYGFHIIQVLEKDPNRALDQDQLARAKSGAVSKWLETAMQSPDVKRVLNDTQKTWVYKRIKWTPPQS